MERLLPPQMQQLLLDPQTPRRTQPFLLDPEMQTFLLARRTVAARLLTFARASNSGPSAVWLKLGRRTLGAIRRGIDRAGVMADESTLSNVSEVNVTPQEPLNRIHWETAGWELLFQAQPGAETGLLSAIHHRRLLLILEAEASER